ncbi:alpha/beta hydrolase [Flavisolibacter nicotianae]|uniref:alpha/beta hydrolase n=1 Tax=Flavisolibacter nicotianae TaxID=2364882 RepID=UPI0013C4B900|nr:alpha/beta hydrolase [Flavisolibacter nicotianae]
MKQFYTLFFLLVVFVSCQKETTGNTVETGEKVLQNVSYGNDGQQRMDIYLPANHNTTSTRALVLIHGGAWTSGDKTDFNEFISILKQRLPDYAVFNINYRLAAFPATNLFPTQENDVKAAFDFILSKVSDYGFNQTKIVVLGASAGSHLALLQGYKNATPRLKAIVDMFGPSDLTAFYNSLTEPIVKSTMQDLLGGTPTTNASLYQSSSPINYVTAQSPPTLVFHGGQDPLVPLSQSSSLKAKLDALKVPAQLVVYPAEGHGWEGVSLTDTYEKIDAFLRQYNP